MTGIVLADLLARTKHKSGFVLMGHSLGARVIYYALSALSTKRNGRPIKEVYLLGGAVGNDEASWRGAASAVVGNIYNLYSDRDRVLAALYKMATAGQSAPVGYHGIEGSLANVHNIDVTRQVAGHTKYKPQLSSILTELRAGPSYMTHDGHGPRAGPRGGGWGERPTSAVLTTSPVCRSFHDGAQRHAMNCGHAPRPPASPKHSSVSVFTIVSSPPPRRQESPSFHACSASRG